MDQNVKTTAEGAKEKKLPIGADEIREAKARFQKYKDGKRSLDERVKNNEQFWKMRHWDKKTTKEEVHPTGWLLNTIHSKHADMMDGYPAPNIRAKEKNDVGEAKILTEIVPVILETSGFKEAYSKACTDKINKGTGVYGIFWDKTKNFGKGDISVKRINLLNLFFEPGIEDIQESPEVFYVCEKNIKLIEQMYPQTKGKLSASGETVEHYENEENIDRSDKCLVFDWYYKKWQNGRMVLHYCKFVGDEVLYASENDTQRPTMPRLDPVTNEPLRDEIGNIITVETDKSTAEKGWYEHGMFPFVLDVMFPVEGSPCGYGFTDLFRGTQEDIDILSHSIVKTAVQCSNPRFFYSESAGINLEDYADSSKEFVKYSGNVEDIKQIEPVQMPSIVVDILLNKIEELKEVSGNRDVNNGSTSSGVTAASAIAALQEHAGKGSRDNLQNTYEKFKAVTYQIIELIRQFYDTSRQFRIVGQDGAEHFTEYSNANIKPQHLGNDFGVDYGYRVPQFDIVVSAQKATAYSKLSQNEFALQLYSAGMFNPQNADVALATINIMDFEGKDDVMQTIKQNQTLFKQVQLLYQVAMGLAQKYEPQTAVEIQMTLQGGQTGGQTMPGRIDTQMTETNSDGTVDNGEHAIVEKARAQSQQSTQVA